MNTESTEYDVIVIFGKDQRALGARLDEQPVGGLPGAPGSVQLANLDRYERERGDRDGGHRPGHQGQLAPHSPCQTNILARGWRHTGLWYDCNHIQYEKLSARYANLL